MAVCEKTLIEQYLENAYFSARDNDADVTKIVKDDTFEIIKKVFIEDYSLNEFIDYVTSNDFNDPFYRYNRDSYVIKLSDYDNNLVDYIFNNADVFCAYEFSIYGPDEFFYEKLEEKTDKELREIIANPENFWGKNDDGTVIIAKWL